jgi:hypothetical protein
MIPFNNWHLADGLYANSKTARRIVFLYPAKRKKNKIK